MEGPRAERVGMGSEPPAYTGVLGAGVSRGPGPGCPHQIATKSQEDAADVALELHCRRLAPWAPALFLVAILL